LFTPHSTCFFNRHTLTPESHSSSSVCCCPFLPHVLTLSPFFLSLNQSLSATLFSTHTHTHTHTHTETHTQTHTHSHTHIHTHVNTRTRTHTHAHTHTNTHIGTIRCEMYPVEGS